MIKEFVVDLKDAKTENEVFQAFNEKFKDILKDYSWKISSWNAMNDFFWGLIQGPEVTDEPNPDFYKDLDEIVVKVINSRHLENVPTDPRYNIRSTLQALQNAFDHIKEGQKERTTSDDLPIFRNSKLEILD